MRRSTMACRSGVTLVELLVVMVILGIAAGVVGLAISPFGVGVAQTPDWQLSVTEARSRSIASGRAVQVLVHVPRATAPTDAAPDEPESVVRQVTALPDGSVLAPAGLAIARLTGRALSREVSR